MGKDKKQFPLDSKDNCCIYLCRIISSCELCMDKLKKYNKQTDLELGKHSSKDLIPYEIYSELSDKSYNIISYLLNLLGDCQTSSISYFKYRKHIQNRIARGTLDIPLTQITDETAGLLSDFNKMRNWINHVPESLLIQEMEMVCNGTMQLPMNPVEITRYENVTYEYFEHLYLSNVEFYKDSRQIIQAAKRDYSLLMGESILYPRVCASKPLDVQKSIPTIKSAEVQGLQAEKDGSLIPNKLRKEILL